ncbi:MarR family winged helix-turn-helix transcriptional regulator [Flavobacterium kingsejongi]|uniref:MarR family transcriptional regulator n=1 Tax=Flavobacterium kingsejongi TaxID=1678728 RepID=A0A2S1LKJ5_9FLAO|nr:MarR family transcriptional regulator [Flavobacterium kingsejongi]AWG24294.1 MarR family transcriptional regulator [Flavobacterium kingsejongi]
MDSLHLNNQLCFPIYALSRQMTALYRPHLDKMGLTYPQYLVMLALWEHETVSVKKLGNLLWLDSGTLTPLLKRMEENELLSRSRSKTDERVVNISLSDKGKTLRESAKDLPDLLKQQLENDGVQLEQLRAQLQQLLAVTTAQCKL